MPPPNIHSHRLQLLNRTLIPNLLYPETAGVAEVVSSGIRINPEDHAEVAAIAHELLGNPEKWDKIVEQQIRDVLAYPSNSHAARLQEIWNAEYSPEASSV